MSAITDNLPAIGWGLLVTLVISVLSYLGGLLLGSLMAIFRVGPIPPLRALGAAWVTVACNIPNLCLMVLVGLALPNVGIRIPLFWSVIVALIFSSSGFVCETVRSGINSVPKGQIEAARALACPSGSSFVESFCPRRWPARSSHWSTSSSPASSAPRSPRRSASSS